MTKLNKTVIAALQAIKTSGTVTADVGKPLVQQGLIEVNQEDVTNGVENARARLTAKGEEGIAVKPAVTNTGAAPASTFAIITNAVPPESKRGVGRVAGPSKYPFEQLEKGASFFVAADASTPEPLKTLGSAVSNATNKYRVDTGKKEQVERTKRDGKKAALDAAGNKIKEQVEVPVYEYPRKFVIRGVKTGQVCGGWTANADGVLITRTV